MESESVRGGEKLVPHLFQFLVLLANDQSKLITVPQVCMGMRITNMGGIGIILFSNQGLHNYVQAYM